ncbi:hypothetical protein IWW38_000618 [Coemansia aciculifera]|uniref:Uncharacterized protein n=1 Tax=Coemansia aciculifera TaxID=417176 RepID=A0ACC1MAB1_9FUNG|nr:hypothetical protein IWW38_000618 [Coemansia aciculifera]
MDSTQRQPLPRLWTLAERRALFQYTRALQVYRHTEPDWALVGARLGRDARSCKFLASYMIRSWIRHSGLLSSVGSKKALSVDAGVTAKQLLRGMAGEEGETAEWLRRLAVPPEPALLAKPMSRHSSSPRKKGRRGDVGKPHAKWSGMDVELMLDLYPMLRPVETRDMSPLIEKIGCTLPSIRTRKSSLMAKLDKPQCKPLTVSELDAVRAAVGHVSADKLAWKDLRSVLPGRSFCEVYFLLERFRDELYQYEKLAGRNLVKH